MQPEAGPPMSLPAYMRALDEGRIARPSDSDISGVVAEGLPAKTAAATAVPTRAQQALDAEFAKWRTERDEQAIYDRHAIAETIRRKREAAAAMNYSNNPIQNAERRFHESRKWDRNSQPTKRRQ